MNERMKNPFYNTVEGPYPETNVKVEQKVEKPKAPKVDPTSYQEQVAYKGRKEGAGSMTDQCYGA